MRSSQPQSHIQLRDSKLAGSMHRLLGQGSSRSCCYAQVPIFKHCLSHSLCIAVKLAHQSQCSKQSEVHSHECDLESAQLPAVASAEHDGSLRPDEHEQALGEYKPKEHAGEHWPELSPLDVDHGQEYKGGRPRRRDNKQRQEEKALRRKFGELRVSVAGEDPHSDQGKDAVHCGGPERKCTPDCAVHMLKPALEDGAIKD